MTCSLCGSPLQLSEATVTRPQTHDHHGVQVVELRSSEMIVLACSGCEHVIEVPPMGQMLLAALVAK